MLTQDLLELFAEQWLGGVDAAAAHRCDLICFCGRPLEDYGNRALSNAIYDLVTPDRLDGLVVWASVLGIRVGRQRMEEYCRRFDPLPIVCVEQPIGNAPLVLMENRTGMYAAVNHLIDVHGRRRVAFVRGPATHDGAEERYRGYLDALAEHGLAPEPDLVSPVPRAWDPETAVAFVARTIAGGVLPDAFAAANDDLATGVLSALAAHGVSAPDEVAVVGFDNSTNVRTHDLGFDGAFEDDPGAVRRIVNISVDTLSLTTVRAPFRELGYRAVEVALARIAGEPVPDVVTVPTELVVRHSCGCLPAGDHPSLAAGSADVVTAMRQALMLDRLPADWPEKLCQTFASDPVAFPPLLDRLVRVSLRSGESIENWWRVLYALRRLIDHSTASPAEVARAENLWLYAQILLNDTADRHWRYIQVVAEKRNQIVREIGQRLATAPDVAGLAGILAEELPHVGIPGCYLAAYEPAVPAASGTGAGPQARLLLAYQNGAPVDVDPDAAVFPSARIVPGDRLRRDRPTSMVALPLHFKGEQLGFVVFELGPPIGWIYAELGEQLSSALHRAFMVERERAALAAVEEAHRRAERHRLAGELHDSVSQALFSMTLHTRAVQLAVQRLDLDPQDRVIRGLAELRELTQGALTEMRALIFQLRPDALHDEGLVAAVRRHAAAVAARERFEVRVHAPADRLPLDERAEEELFRVVQEALHNCVKHARARRVDIRFDGGFDGRDEPGTLVVEVADNGVGFDPGLPHPGHLGLDSMGERTRRLGGRFTVDSSVTGSTTVRAVLPDILRPRPANGGESR
jgi:signal transduction histidine kinase/DNA-binding LacI/PurR family transcriptional regulator